MGQKLSAPLGARQGDSARSSAAMTTRRGHYCMRAAAADADAAMGNYIGLVKRCCPRDASK